MLAAVLPDRRPRDAGLAGRDRRVQGAGHVRPALGADLGGASRGRHGEARGRRHLQLRVKSSIFGALPPFAERRMKHLLVVPCVCALCGCSEPATPPSDASAPSIYRIEELTWPAIDALDRDRTLFILPVGMLEQHGPHLPVGADTLAVVHEANAVAQNVSRAIPGWSVVLMPEVAYGHSGANNLGDLPIHPGTYALRQATFRSLLADIGA